MLKKITVQIKQSLPKKQRTTTMKLQTLVQMLILKLQSIIKDLIQKKLFKLEETLSFTAIKINPVNLNFHQLQFLQLKLTKTQPFLGLVIKKMLEITFMVIFLNKQKHLNINQLRKCNINRFRMQNDHFNHKIHNNKLYVTWENKME